MIRALLRTPTGWLAVGMLALALHAWIEPEPTSVPLPICVGTCQPPPHMNPDGSYGNYR